MDRERQERRLECPLRHVSLCPLNTSARPARSGPENERVWTEECAVVRRGAEEQGGDGRDSSENKRPECGDYGNKVIDKREKQP